jgi:hypothetical protein
LPRSSRRWRARLYEGRIELWHEQTRVAAFDRHANAGGACVDWRHLIDDLCRKPGAFARYRYRQSFYPSLLWREVNDELRERFSIARADSGSLMITTQPMGNYSCRRMGRNSCR